MARFLITGGAGFIGSYICNLLHEKGDSIVCVDNLATGVRKNIENLLPSDRFRFVELDVTKGLDDIYGSFDYVMHLASPASPPDYLKIPIETLLVSSAGTHVALEVARKNKAVFLLASTSEVYGDPQVHPQTEDYLGNVSSIGPRSCYDEGKRYAEAATMAYKRVHNLEVRIIRIFNTFGPKMRMDDGRAVSNFIFQALRGDDITVYGDGSQTRSFCFVSDLVDGILKLLYSSHTGPVNLGNPEEMSILDLAKIIVEYTGSKSKIVHKDLPTDDPKLRNPDISLAKEKLGWEPVVSLKDGLLEVIDYYKTQLVDTNR